MKNELAEVYKRMGGDDGFARWSKRHPREFYQMCSRTDMQPPPAAVARPDPKILASLAMHSLVGVINQQRKLHGLPPLPTSDAADQTPNMNNADSGVPDAVTPNAGAANSKPAAPGTPLQTGGVSDTAHGIADTAAPQPLLEQSKSLQLPRHAVARDKPAPTSDIPGLCIAAVLEGSDNRSTTQKYIDWVNAGGGRGW